MVIFNDLPTLLKNVYDTCDIDFVIDEAKKLTDIEFKQTFREYRNAAKYVYNLLQEKGINAEFITFLALAKAYENVFPNTEKCVRSRTEFGDDLIMGDPTIGVPTIYFEEEACIHWHSSYWSAEHLDPNKVRRSYDTCFTSGGARSAFFSA